MIYVSLDMFLKHAERYINEAKNKTNVYICLDDGTELKLEKFIREQRRTKMNNGDRIRQMNNKELAQEIFRWHEVLFGTEFRFVEDIERYLNEKTEPRNICEEVVNELFG